MQIFFKSRESARSVKSGKIQDNWQGLPEHLKGVTNGKYSIKRWGRIVEAKPTAKETMALTCAKDYRYPEKVKIVQVLKIKKLKEMVK